MTVPAGWEGILSEGEDILWQGRPDGKFVFKIVHAFTFIFGLGFAGFALFWMIMASQAGGFFWAFGLIHFTVGIGLAIGPPFWSFWARRHTWYTLTNDHAYIATDIPMLGRKLKSYQIDRSTRITFEPGQLSSVFFAEEYRRTKNGSRRVDIGFERIPDGDDVYRMIRQIQKDDI